MQIKSYNRNDLQEYIHSDFYRTLNKIPISFHRAVSQINNPYCSDQDILLWVAYENASLAGYVGILPDMIDINENKSKIYWLSCFWVDESFRNENLASQLFFLLIKQYKSQLFISNFLFSLEKVYQGLGIFQPTQYNLGQIFFLNFCFADLVEARFPSLKPVKNFYILAESAFNVVLKIREVIIPKQKYRFNIVENNELDEEFKLFLETYSSTHKGVVRDVEHFRWILNYPWVLEGKADKGSERYFFSSKSEQFEYKLLKLYNSTELEGFVLLMIRDKKLSVNYLYASDMHIESVADYLINLSRNYHFDSITTFDQRLSDTLKNKRINFIFIKNSKLPYIFPRNLEIDSSIFQEGDGDSVFT